MLNASIRILFKMLSWLCVLMPSFLGSASIQLCNPASAQSISSVPIKAVDGTFLSPLNTTSRWIVDSAGKRVKFRCVNWAGHLETNIPEGMNKRTPEDIASWIANNGFNCVRLTYSIDMTQSTEVTVKDSFANAAVSTNQGDLNKAYTDAVRVNPWIAQASTLGTFAYVINALGDKGIRVILDNHVSKAGWCCNPFDGNGWWDQASGYDYLSSHLFNTDNWLNGLQTMAKFSTNHPNVVAMSLRNELRALPGQDLDNHKDWYNLTSLGAERIRGANDDLIVVFGGVQSATQMPFLSSTPLDKAAWRGENKTLYENHVYWFSYPFTGNCDIFDATMGANVGYLLEQGKSFTGPTWLSEFGFGQDFGNANEVSYLDCLVKYYTGNDGDWAIWALQGSYYIREGKLDYDESYGLLSHDWTAWRNDTVPSRMGGMFNVTQGP